MKYILLLLLLSGCSIDRHEANVYVMDANDPNRHTAHWKVVLDRPMSVKIVADGIQIEADSKQPSVLTQVAGTIGEAMITKAVLADQE